MNAIPFNFPRTAGLLAGAVLLLANVRAAEADAFPTFDNNYVKVAATGATLDGSKAAYQAHTQHAKNGAAGIEEMSFGYDLNKDTNLQIDGKAMPGAEDYLLQFKVTKNEVGSVEAGYKRTRTFYDGAGGFFPTTNVWMPIYPRELFVDRGKFFINAVVAMPKAPVFTFSYTNATRTGRKDSTIWGDTNLTGLTATAGRKILPAYIDLNERLETWEATMKHTVGNTTAVFSISGDRMNNLDRRTVDRNVGEVKAYGTIPAQPSTIVLPSLATNATRGYDAQGVKEEAYTLGARIETVVSDKLTVFAGGNFLHADQDIKGDRQITATIATATGIKDLVGGFNVAETTPIRVSTSRPPYSYTSVGTIKQDVLTANIGAQFKPMSDLHVEVAVKAEHYKDSGHNDVNYINNGVVLSTGAVTSAPVSTSSDLNNIEKPWTPSIDVRYTGIRNLALYGEWEYRTAKQDERNNSGSLNVNTSGTTPTGVVSGSITPFANDIKETHSNAKIGANWTPVSGFSARAEFFSKDHENSFTGYGPSAGSFYVLDYDIYGAKLTATLKPAPVLAFTTRYIIQRGKAATSEDGFLPTDSGDSRRYQLSETVDWNPNKAFYMQANAGIVYETIISSYPRVTGTARDVVHNADNNYWNGDVTAGFVIDKDTDAQLQATYYKADNYEPALAAATLPFGAGIKEYTLTAGVKHKFSAKTVGSAKVGYIDSKSDTTGGNANFKGPLAYVAVTHAF